MTEGKYGWKVGQSKSGSLDLKVVLSRSPKNHFRFTAHWHACMHVHTHGLAAHIRFSFLME